MGVALKGGSGDSAEFILTALLSGLLAASLLSVGLAVSVLSGRSSKAIGIAVFLWLLYIILGDLGIMGTAVAMDLGIKQVFALALLNPAEVFKIASVLVLSPRFEILGPVGIYAVRTFGRGRGHLSPAFGAGALDHRAVYIRIHNVHRIEEGRGMKYMLILLVLLGFVACKDRVDTGPQAVRFGEDVFREVQDDYKRQAFRRPVHHPKRRG